MADTKIKMKNTEADGKSLRIQSWNGKLPTFDNEAQRGQAAKAMAAGVDVKGNPDTLGNPNVPAEPVVLAKLSKPDLIAHAESKGVQLSEDDTKALIIEKIEAAAPDVPPGTPPTIPADPATSVNAGAIANFAFSRGHLLQEITLSPGEEKVIGLSAGMFITIKEEA